MEFKYQLMFQLIIQNIFYFIHRCNLQETVEKLTVTTYLLSIDPKRNHAPNELKCN